MNLMTTNDVRVSGSINYDAWRKVFSNGEGRRLRPVFMRAGEMLDYVTLDTNAWGQGATCRAAGQPIAGCGQQCTFCFQQADGDACDGGGSEANDVNIGLGNHPEYCGGGDATKCSAGGSWGRADTTVVAWMW